MWRWRRRSWKTEARHSQSSSQAVATTWSRDRAKANWSWAPRQRYSQSTVVSLSDVALLLPSICHCACATARSWLAVPGFSTASGSPKAAAQHLSSELLHDLVLAALPTVQLVVPRTALEMPATLAQPAKLIGQIRFGWRSRPVIGTPSAGAAPSRDGQGPLTSVHRRFHLRYSRDLVCIPGSVNFCNTSALFESALAPCD
jgi:hypothetical protein